jgi:uncharacterized membrane protein
METIYKGILIIHVLCGFTALTTGIVPMIAKKGGKQHNRWGNIYYWAMFGVFITTVGLFSIKFYEVKLQFFLAVAVASFYQTFTGVRILKSKKTGLNPQRLDWIAAYATIGFGVACFGYMAWNLAHNNAFMGVLFGFFGIVCSGNAWQDIRVFLGKKEIEEMHWFFNHIARMAGSYTATLTAFLVNMSRFFPEWSHLMVWILPGVLASFIIKRVTKKYREKFGCELVQNSWFKVKASKFIVWGSKFIVQQKL